MAKVDNFCSSCTWWSPTYDNDDMKFGTCENIATQERVRLSQDYNSIDNDDDPTIFTEANFGCIYHENKENEKAVNVIKLQSNSK